MPEPEKLRDFTLWAWLSLYPDGTIGNIGAMVGTSHTPLISRNEKIARTALRALALAHWKMTGQACFLVRFLPGELIETLPEPPDADQSGKSASTA
jgi:hypothetical protein